MVFKPPVRLAYVFQMFDIFVDLQYISGDMDCMAADTTKFLDTPYDSSYSDDLDSSFG